MTTNPHSPAPDSVPRMARDSVAHTARLSAVYGLGALALILLARLAGSFGLLPAVWLQALVFVAVAGYPVALAIAWSRGERSVEDEHQARSIVAWALGLLALLAAAWIGLRSPGTGGAEYGETGPVPEPRVAVLPLIDLDGRGDRTFADGMTALLVEGLAAVDGLEVWGRLSAGSFLDVNRDAAAAGARLGVAAVLDGTVRRTPGGARLSIRLLDVESGEPVLTRSADTTSAGLLALRDAMVHDVADALGLEVSDHTLRRLERQRTSPEALDFWMLGRFRWAAGQRGDLAEAASYYGLAIEADSGFTAAWTALADAYATLPRFTRMPPASAREFGAAAARTALRLDADAAGAHTALGEILYTYERDWDGARSHLERAVELDPGDAAPRDRLCELDFALGDLPAAREACARARRRDPLAYRPGWLEAGIARAAGDLPAALARLDSLVAVYPDFEPLAGERAITRLLIPDAGGPESLERGSAEDDLAAWFELLAAPALGDSLAATLAAGRAGEEPPGRVSRALARVADELDPDPAQLVALLAQFGETDRAANLALRALEDRAPGALRFGVLPEYAPLRSREGVADALEAAGLPVR